jgi:phenylacetate-coenzyme A ligase PaaK-like adenylate-forming protein
LSLHQTIFNINSDKAFKDTALKVFNHQYANNLVYQQFCNYLKVKPETITEIEQIPFLPIEFFKTHPIKTSEFNEEAIFLSSGTTGANQSKHLVKDLSIYETSFNQCFKTFYGDIEDYCVLALLPSYLEREGSSLIYMVDVLIQKSNHQESGFFLKNEQFLIEKLQFLTKNKQKMILFGVSFALLDLAENYKIDLSDVIIMETGGMKGRREELTREELHSIYKQSFNVAGIHSEYGMTELLSQAYSKGNGIFNCPAWMKILIRDINDPFRLLGNDKTGGINVIDLANINSCSFIATQDLGKMTNKGFEVLGRFDNSDLRGCNLLLS